MGKQELQVKKIVLKTIKNTFRKMTREEIIEKIIRIYNSITHPDHVERFYRFGVPQTLFGVAMQIGQEKIRPIRGYERGKTCIQGVIDSYEGVATRVVKNERIYTTLTESSNLARII